MGPAAMRLYIGLCHYPVYNKRRERIASAVTTLDLHDLSRLAKTYEARRVFVITPLKAQQDLAEQVKGHWTRGYGALYNEDRKAALELLAVTASLEKARDDVKRLEGEPPMVIATDASVQDEGRVSYRRARELIEEGRVVMLLFGTAWGLDAEVIRASDYVLDPIMGKEDYNHLSVRTAAAIILDRLVRRGTPGGDEEEDV
jgi:hypothetical protein